MGTITHDEAMRVLRAADLLCSEGEVQAALDRMAKAITETLGETDPVVLVVMNGALIPAGHLLTRLSFPFQIGYLHATRYRGGIRGGELHWIARPSIGVGGRTVLVIDDIFDEGITLKAIIADLARQQVKALFSAVLVNKVHDRKAPGLSVDFIGLDVPDRYVFGCGMDYKEYLRNLPGIYAVSQAE